MFFIQHRSFIERIKGFLPFAKQTKPSKVYWKASLIVLFKLHHVGYLQEIVIIQAHCL